MNRASGREVRVGMIVLSAIVGFLCLVAVATNGPGFLSSRQTIDVVFRDGQGIRLGSPVRVAGLDNGRVVGLDLTEVEGALKARVRISLPADLAARLKQDVKITIQANITGQNCVNIVSSGRSSVALVPGQVVQGVETSFFDPVLEQVGLGPVERSHLSHTIAEVRQTVDAVGPRLRLILATLQDTAEGMREMSNSVRPAVEASAGQMEALARQLNTAAPRMQSALAKFESLTAQMDALLAENRPNVRAMADTLRQLTATLNDIVVRDRPQIDGFLTGLNTTRARADRVLYQTELLTGQGVDILSRNKANLERTFTNVRDATDWGQQLVEKLYGNPFYLSPFYKPTPEDKRASMAFDNAHALVRGVKELSDTVKTLEAMQARQNLSPDQQRELTQLYGSAKTLRDWLDRASRTLATELQSHSRK